MKFRSFIIVLLAVLMAFAFASCKQEPKEEPKPTPKPYSGDFYQIEVTEGVDKDYYNRDKIKLVWNVNVKEGDTISLKYRSERDVYQWDIRNGSHKWVYETSKNGFVDPVLGDDGWYTMTYTIGKTIDGAAGASSALGIYFRGNFVTTDIFEIKEIMLNDEELEVVPETITSAAQLNDPAEEFDWSVKNYAVLFATGKPGEVDKTPIAEKVIAGGKVTGAPIAKENYSLTIYTDEGHTSIFDPETPITEEKIFYYEYVGDPRTVTYVTNSTTVIEPVQVHYNDLLIPPADPKLDGKAFKAWYKDQELTTKWDFLTEHIEDNLTLYAGYGDPVTVTFDAQNGEAEHTKVTVAKDNPVAMPTEAPTNGSKMFLGWFTEAECTTAYNFAAPVESTLTLYAGWVSATDVTLDLNYTGAPAATTFKTALDVALSADDEHLVVETIRPGYIFEGWCTDAACATAYDYTTVVTGPFTLYAKWTDGAIYKIVATKGDGSTSYDKFILDWQSGDLKVNKDDTIAFAYRTTVPFTLFNIRDNETTVDTQKDKWIYESGPETLTSYVEGTDGWIYVTYTFAEKFASGHTPNAGSAVTYPAVFRFDLISNKIRPGDVLEVKGITLNAEEIALTKVDTCATTFETLEAIDEWTSHTVTFNTNGGSAIDAAEVEYGAKVAKPADPTKDGEAFLGWYSDADLTKEFKFEDTPITADTTIYAKFVNAWVITLNSNYGDTPATSVVYAEKNEVMAAPKGLGRPGYFFDGWYDEAACTTAHDFSVAVTANATIYAKWKAPTEAYEFTATVSESRFQYRWHEDTIEMFNAGIQAGDVFTLMIKFPEGNSRSELYWRLRVRSGEAHITENTYFSDTTKDGDWYVITAVVPKSISNGSGLYLQVYGAEEANWAVGDKMIIKAFAFNGVEIPIDAQAYDTASTHKGAYEKVKADGAVIAP